MASPSPVSRADAWDSIWAEFDSRQPPTPPIAAPCSAPRPPRPRWPGLLVLALALPAAWFAGPTLVDADILNGLARRDTAALTERIDWPALTPRLARELRAAGGLGQPPGASRFLDIMAAEMAGAWQQAGTRDRVLAGRSAQGGTGLRAARAEAPGRIALDLGVVGGAALTVTLSLTDPARLGWAFTGLRFAEAAGPGAAPPPTPRRPRLVEF